ncbi:hypothetical protein ACOMHN_052580 [Nucella lapillus]
MDFSSLDLLASTALRDNNPSHSDTTATSAKHHPQHNHHDSVEKEEDDDDEADGNRDNSVEGREGVVVSDSEEEEDMGSVKCGKHKKNSAKQPTSNIFVGGKKCVDKNLPADKSCGQETRGEVKTGESNGQELPVQVNHTEQEGNSPSSLIVHCNMAPQCPAKKDLKPESSTQPSCNGVNSLNHQNALPADGKPQQAESSLKDISTEAQRFTAPTDRVPCDSEDRPCEKVSQEPVPDSKETPCGSVTERGCDGVNTSVTDRSSESSPAPTGAAEICDRKESVGNEQTEKQEEGVDCCGTSDPQSSALHTDRQTSDMEVSPSLENKKDSDCGTSGLIHFTVPASPHVEKSACLDSVDTAMETRTPKICDEDFAVVTCSRTEVQVGEQSGSCKKVTVDQTIGSSGTKKPQPSTSSNNNMKSILSPPPVPPPLPVCVQVALGDHSYCSRSKGRPLENTDDSGDAFESADENVSADEIERRPRSLSVDSVYLQYNLAGLPNQQETPQNDKLALLSPTLSVDSISNDSSVSEHSSAAGGQCYSILVGSPNPKGTTSRPSLLFMDSQSVGPEKSAPSLDGDCRMGPSMLEPGSSASQLDINIMMAGGPKCGKFRIGTFGSFSNSHLDLEKEGKKSKGKNGLSDPPMKTPLPSLVMPSPGSPFPLLQSPGMEWDRSDAGSEAPDDLESTTTEDKFLSSSHDSESFGSTVSHVWRHPVFHDHDYCSKEVSEEYLGKPVAPTPQVKTGKRKYVKKKDRQDEEEKLRKGKYLKRELLKQDNRFSLGGGRGMDSRLVAAKSSLLTEPLSTKPNPVGRPRKRTEKQLEEYDAETGAKMKITGKYQDQYVYYLNKSSRNRRRKVDDKISSGDKIILPAPKPGDIVVPHLSDADCEVIRRGGRNAMYNNSSHPAGSAQLPQADCGDMVSSIVNTILSMETEHGDLQSPLSTAFDGVGGNEDFADIEGNLTSEQVKLLIDCLDGCPMEETTTSQELDLFTGAESVCAASATIDSLAATSVEEDLMVPGVTPHPSISGTSEPSSQLEKMDTSSPDQVNLGQDELACNIKTENMDTSDMTGMPVPPTSQPSVEKNLEFLKTPFFPETSVASSDSHELFVPALPLMETMPDSKPEDVNETPWIVTVTLYYNDIPAIVINNMPHVRLVDIHRQILPAKDTGILKKRCQLMNIHVSNCSEMQRYFLVQYGRAHNSKSTLVISKDEAQDLIKYYADPPPRNLRGEDGSGFKRSSSYGELRSIIERPNNNPGRHSTLAFNQPRKRGGFRRRPLPSRSHNLSPEPAVTPSVTPAVEEPLPATPQPATPPPPSSVKGLRHKKINFREMLRGEDTSSPLNDGAMEDDAALANDTPVARGRGKPAATGGRKRRGAKDTGGATAPAKRGRKAWRKKNEAEEAASKQPEADIVVDKDPPSTVVVGTKSKKRSPGSAAGGNLNASSRSPKSKYGPIKVNVKSLVSSGGTLSLDGSQPRKKNLFGRKSSSSSAVDVVVDGPGEAVVPCNPLRVLRISHQDVEATPLPVSSPTAEVHLDLYKQASSPCVRCRTCDKFLSVGNFVKHQHASGGQEVIGSTVHGDVGSSHPPRRILVPLNKENISLEEQRLWNEFVALQESLDCTVSVASMGAYPLTPLSPASPIGSSLNMFSGEGGHSLAVDELHLMTPESPHPASLPNGHNEDKDSEVAPASVTTVMEENRVLSPCSALDAINGKDSSLSAEAAKCTWDSPLLSFPASPLPPTTHTLNEEKWLARSAGSEDRELQLHPQTVPCSSGSKKQWPLQQRSKRNSPAPSVRTSSRKRETKRLYSFENYDYGVGGKKGGRGDTDTQDFEDDLQDTTTTTVLDGGNSVASSNALLHLASATPVHELQNN